nr:uncharacterized protein LOC104652204 [Saimiri boliviensis boliviensis]
MRVARRLGAQAAAAAQLLPGDSGDARRWGTPPAAHSGPAAAPWNPALIDRLISRLDGPEPGMAVQAGRGGTKKAVHPPGGRGCLSWHPAPGLRRESEGMRRVGSPRLRLASQNLPPSQELELRLHSKVFLVVWILESTERFSNLGS